MAQTPSQIPFFATPPDIAELLAAVETDRPVRYILAGSFEDSAAIREYSSFAGITSLGQASTGDQALEPVYLVLEQRLAATPRFVRQQNGKERVVIDQLYNPDSVALRPGGLFTASVLIAGSVGTSSRSNVSMTLMSVFKNRIGEKFRRIRSYYVGARAQALLTDGARLTASVKAPIEFDLSPPTKAR